MPEGKPPFTSPSPCGLKCNQSRRRVTRTQNRADEHVTGIMNAVIDARKGDGQRHRQHEPKTAPVINEKNHRGGKPIARVRRRHAGAAAFVGGHLPAVVTGLRSDVAFADGAEQPRLGQRDERARPGDGVFDGVGDQAVTQRQNQEQQQQAKAQADIAFPSKPAPSRNRAGKNRALLLKNGISQSKTGLANDRLTKRNKLVSSACSQCIAASLAGTGKLETQLRSGLEFEFQPAGIGGIKPRKTQNVQ